jgi:hypothetical protein
VRRGSAELLDPDEESPVSDFPWPHGERELAQVRAFNKKLAWLPRFKIRNRLTPRLIQALLRAGQLGGNGKLRQHGLSAERKIIDTVPVRIIRPKGKDANRGLAGGLSTGHSRHLERWRICRAARSRRR